MPAKSANVEARLSRLKRRKKYCAEKEHMFYRQSNGIEIICSIFHKNVTGMQWKMKRWNWRATKNNNKISSLVLKAKNAHPGTQKSAVAGLKKRTKICLERKLSLMLLLKIGKYRSKIKLLKRLSLLWVWKKCWTIFLFGLWMTKDVPRKL